MINIIRGTDKSETINGTDGDDIIYDGYGTDKVYAGAGDDVFATGNLTKDIFDGGEGRDTFFWGDFNPSGGDNPVGARPSIDLTLGTVRDAAGVRLATLVSVENVYYTGGGAVINGTDGANAIYARRNSLVTAGGGDDVIGFLGSNGEADGGAGEDTVLVDFSTVNTGVGAGYTVSLAKAGETQEFVFGEYHVLRSIENLTGSALDDTLIGDGGANKLGGNKGHDTLIGGAGDDLLAGDGGIVVSESYVPGAFLTQQPGAAGNDLLEGGLGNDTLIGGGGIDTASYAHAAGRIVVDLGAGTSSGADGQDTLTGIEAVLGSAFDDRLYGSGRGDRLDGGIGADRIVGRGGGDVYVVDNLGDVVVEAVGGGRDTVESSITYALPANVENLVLMGFDDIDGTGNDAANVLTGNDGFNRLAGGRGDDTYVIQNAFDTVIEQADGGIDTVRSAESATLADNVENLVLLETSNPFVVLDGTGNDLDNTITGTRGNNVIDGGKGADLMIGGAGGIDTFYIDNVGDKVVIRSGFAITYTSISLHAFYGGTEYHLTGSEDLTFTGTRTFQRVWGNDGDNRIDDGGGNGDDILEGGKGNDTYIVRDHARLIEAAGEGIDTVIAGRSFALGDNFENLELLPSTTGATLTGNALDNRITGSKGADTLDGKGGADRMTGGLGDDTYYVDNAGDRIVEGTDAGRDRVYSSVDLSLAANVEELFLQGSARHATGNKLANTLAGTNGDDVLDGRGGADRMEGGLGDDTYHVDNAADSISEAGGRDVVLATASYSLANANGVERLELLGTVRRGTGNDLDNVIIGNAAANVLDGGLGNDRLVGGAGDDTYIVDNPYDEVVEKADGGTDTLVAAYDATLAADLENLTLSGVFSISGTGNAGANVITGNSGDNVLDGKGGADRMAGGGGHDIFIVDNAGDTVSGTGTVRASVSFAVSGQLDLVLTGSDAIDGTGSEQENRLIGNGAANVLTGLGGNDMLDGGGGADTLKGGQGDDIYIAANAGMTLVEDAGAGRDTVLAAASVTLAANFENLVGNGVGAIALSGNESDNIIFGNSGGNAIHGGGGADLLWGVGGADSLTGGAGADRFVISTDDPTDTIADFVSGTDKIVVINDVVAGTLLAGGFVVGTSARDADDIAIYDKANGKLYVDADGNGPEAKVLLASFTPGTALAASDFELVLRFQWTAQVNALDLPFLI
ncbi:hypothetical protein [Novosphingobium sp.]|uniref:hypothetical protein n=1 Tax=Novosphingobium sp. TaxID=1874826 RepID=UPI0038B9B20E